MIYIGELKKDTILGHELVPKHIIMTEEEVKELLDKYNISVDNLPGISINDPVVKAIGAKKGDVLKIIRDSYTAGKAIYYRVVRD